MAQAKPKLTPKRTKAKAPTTATTITSPTTDQRRPRRLRLGNYKSFRLQRKIKPGKPTRTKLPAAPKLFWAAVAVLARHWKLFLGIVVIYLLLTVVLAGGIGGKTDLQTSKSVLEQVFTGQWAAF